jgi:hypothetical protein
MVVGFFVCFENIYISVVVECAAFGGTVVLFLCFLPVYTSGKC